MNFSVSHHGSAPTTTLFGTLGYCFLLSERVSSILGDVVVMAFEYCVANAFFGFNSGKSDIAIVNLALRSGGADIVANLGRS